MEKIIKRKTLFYCIIFQHGRLKVRSTAEQEIEKKKEREEKVRIYRQTTSRIYEKVCSSKKKIDLPLNDDSWNLFTEFQGDSVCDGSMQRSIGDRDDEALQLTRDVLSQNPEITTLWNYRREILEDRHQTS